MDVEQLIGRTLQEKASAAVVPPAVDGAAIRRRAVRRRNRVVGVLAAAAVAAVAMVSVVVSGRDAQDTGPADTPERTRDLEGPVWGDHRGLHAGSELFKVETTSSAIAVVRDALLLQRSVGSSYSSEPTSVVLLVRPGEKPRVVGRNATGAMGDTDGTLAAWVEGEELVVVDTSTGAERRRVEIGPNKGSELGPMARVPVLYLDDGEVVYAAATGVWRLALDDPAGAPQRLGGPTLLDVAPRVRVLAEESSVNEWSLARRPSRIEIRIDGRSVGRFGPTLAEASISPDSRYVATATDYDKGHRLVVLDTATARPVRLTLPDLPVRPTGYPWGWVEDHTLVVALSTATTANAPADIYQCDVASARCNRLSTTQTSAVPY